MRKIVDNYTGSDSWYRKYDDGFIEQGGKVSRTFNTDSTWDLTFPHPFNSAPLYISAIFIAPRTQDGLGGEVAVKTNSATATKVTFINDHYGNNKIGYIWEAKGY